MEKEQKIQALFSDVAGFSSTSRDFLEQNGDNIIRLSEQGAAQLPMFEKYAPEYPCLLRSMVDWTPRMESAYRGFGLHINLETIPRQPRGYGAGDAPSYADKRGPMSAADCQRRPGLQPGEPARHPLRAGPPDRRRRTRSTSGSPRSPPAPPPARSTSPPASPAPGPNARSSTPSPHP